MNAEPSKMQQLLAEHRANQNSTQKGIDPRQRVTPKKKGKPSSERFGIFNRFVDEFMSKMHSTKAQVWITLWRDANSEGIANVGRQRIANRIGKHPKTVSIATTWLVEEGYLNILWVGGQGNSVSRYQLLLPEN